MAQSPVIFDAVWKKFRKGERHDSLRDLLPSMARRVLRRRHSAELDEQEFWAVKDVSFEVQPGEARKAGLIGAVSLLLGTVLPFIIGALVARSAGYTDAISMTTIGAGAVTYIVGPVTGAAIGASSDVIALSIATGVVKAVMVMIGTPLLARFMGLKTPRSAMIFGGLAGTVSGVSAGLAATDRRLVPYGALIATFHTGVGCLLGPSLLYFATRALVGG